MSEYFIENRKFLGLSGVLGRRDFLVNYLVVEFIKLLLFATPATYFIFVKPEFLSLVNSNNLPAWLILVLSLVTVGLFFPSIVRRIRDILGEEDDNKIFLISSILSVLIFAGYTPGGAFVLGEIIPIIIMLVLLLKKGKITGEKPKSEIILFNWGAFFGTWIWGLVNKTYVTLWMIPLMFTCAWFPFMLICGLKGNEWAYKNTKHEDIEGFHRSQLNQSVFFVLFMPIISGIIFVILTLLSGFALRNYTKTHPQFVAKMETHLKQFQMEAVDSTFDKIELTNSGEYNFYIDPSGWNELSTDLKKVLFKNAINYVLIKNNKQYFTMKDIINSIDMVNKIKIYSTYNNETLCEYHLAPEAAKKILSDINNKQTDSNEILKIFDSGFKFNNNPSLP